MSPMKAFQRKMAKLYLDRESARHVRAYPQLACFAYDTISVSLHIDGQYERYDLELLGREILSKLDSGKQALDIGANIGNHSLFFAKHFDKVVSFEPHPRTFRLLELNADLSANLPGKVYPLPLAASDQAGTVEVEQDLLNLGATSVESGRRALGEEGAITVSFQTVRVDDLADVQDGPPVAFMKLDIEGHEEQALRGAEKTILRDKPIIALEVLPGEIKDGGVASVEYLRTLGYDCFIASRLKTPVARYSRRTSKRLKTLMSLVGRVPSMEREFVEVSLPFEAGVRHSMLICSIGPIRR